jgi:CelD/BcsL family acetyltransferase involved in cellulose biosynthesis
VFGDSAHKIKIILNKDAEQLKTFNTREWTSHFLEDLILQGDEDDAARLFSSCLAALQQDAQMVGVTYFKTKQKRMW